MTDLLKTERKVKSYIRETAHQKFSQPHKMGFLLGMDRFISLLELERAKTETNKATASNDPQKTVASSHYVGMLSISIVVGAPKTTNHISI